jgi:CHAD domain-containing protein
MSDKAFKLKKKESARKGIRRVARGRVEDAVELLRDPGTDPTEAVHGARKDVKKLRAALRLVRPVIGEKAYRSENERYRDAARELSDVRDAQVRAETLDGLAERFADREPPGGWWAVRTAVTSADESPNGELESLRDEAAERIAAGGEEIDDWPLKEKGFELLEPGLKRSYARARKRFSEARGDPSDERLHELRKRAKDFWYHLRLIRRSWPVAIGALADEAHRLSDLLGDDHDLVVFGEWLERGDAPLTAEQRQDLDGLIDERRGELQSESFALAERLLAEKPKRLIGRLRAYWEAPKL